MRHRKNNKKLGRSPAHRQALLASRVCNLIEERRIRTTLPKAKLARSLADKAVGLGKAGTLADRRQAISILRQEKRVAKLFSEIAPQFGERRSGFTRITKLGRRASDGAEMALLEWVGLEFISKKKQKKTDEGQKPAAS